MQTIAKGQGRRRMLRKTLVLRQTVPQPTYIGFGKMAYARVWAEEKQYDVKVFEYPKSLCTEAARKLAALLVLYILIPGLHTDALYC